MSDVFDIVFSFDTTGSMYCYLEEVRGKLGEMVRDLKMKIPGIRIAIYAHGDYCDKGSTYVTKYLNFSNDTNQICNFVQTVSATGGGDTPECYELVMREVQENLSWNTNSQKSLVIIGDAPPHEKSEEQNYRHLDWKEETVRLRNMDIKIYAVECGSSYQNFYQYIAARTFGYYMPLSNIRDVKELLMKICFREAGIIDGTSDSAVVNPSIIVEKKTAVDNGDKEVSDDETDDEYEMRCFLCKTSKPLKEFPKMPLSDECNHYPGHCLRCAVSYARLNGRCPHKNCPVKVDPDCETVRFFEAKLNRMFVDYSKVLEENRKKLPGHEGPMISVSAMNGDTVWLPYDSNLTIKTLKEKVQSELGVSASQQKILFKEHGLKENKGPGQPCRLSDYGITANSSLTVIVPLYCIPENLDHVVFDLSWEFPKSHADFLDASCLAFEGTEFIQVIDWNHTKNSYYLKDAVEHSAKNVLTEGGRVGHQTIHVHLKTLPSNISHLFFTLSSWKAPNLSAFTNPSLQFYEASEPGINLCSTTINHALNSQAVVMCYLVRKGSQWQIFECDVSGCVNGNTKRYNPIRQRIAELITNDLNI